MSVRDRPAAEAAERHRACTAPDLTPEQFARVCAIEAAPAECLCGRCDGRGQVRYGTDGTETWVTPCRGYVPDRDRWAS